MKKNSSPASDSKIARKMSSKLLKMDKLTCKKGYTVRLRYGVSLFMFVHTGSKAGHGMIGPKGSNGGASKNAQTLTSSPSYIFWMETMPGFLLFVFSILEMVIGPHHPQTQKPPESSSDKKRNSLGSFKCRIHDCKRNSCVTQLLRQEHLDRKFKHPWLYLLVSIEVLILRCLHTPQTF